MSSPPYRVLVFPSCNEPGLEVVHALLKSNKVEVFGGSSPAHAEYDPSRLLLKNHFLFPQYGKEGFQESFMRLLAYHRIGLVFPTVDSLVAEFSSWRLPGVTFVTPRPEIARLLLSKSATYRRLDHVVPVPRVFAPGKAPIPAFAKPDAGGGAKGAFPIRTARELVLAEERGLLLTEYLPGDEYTVDCASDLSGALLFAGVRLRGSVGRSISLGTKGVRETEIEGLVLAIAGELRIEGPWFAQFKRDARGRAVLLEVNARGGGSAGLARFAGVNIPLLSVFLFQGCPVEIPRTREGVVMVRYLRNLAEGPFPECVLWDLDDTLIRKDGKPDPEAVASLFDCRNRGVRQFLLTKNPDVRAVLASCKIPDFFEEVRVADDKSAEIQNLLGERGLAPESCALVNDSYVENLAVQKRLPGLRTVTPDTLELLGREKVG